MKNLVLAIVVTLFSFNTFAAGRCVVAFDGYGSKYINQKAISKKNYQETDLSDIKTEDMLVTIKNLEYEDLGNYKLVQFTQKISMAFQESGIRYYNDVHVEFAKVRVPLEDFNSLGAEDLEALIGRVRTAFLPQCAL